MSSSPNSNDLRHPRDPARRDATDVARGPTPHGPVIFPRVGEVWVLRYRREAHERSWLYLAVEEDREDLAFVVLDAPDDAEEAGSLRHVSKALASYWAERTRREGGRGGLTWKRVR